MMSEYSWMRQRLINASKKHFEAHIEKHKMNVEVYLTNPAGIGEHSDIMEAIEGELSQMAEYEDKLEMINKYFGE
jgi:hypothetical protein